MARHAALLLLLLLGAAAGELLPPTFEQVLSSGSEDALRPPPEPGLNSAAAAVLQASPESVISSGPPPEEVPTCPDYSTYSYAAHFPKTGGKYNLPYQRPSPECRKFNVSEVEDTIMSMKKLVKDPDLFRLFENCFPNTLDTAVTWKGLANNTEDYLYEEEVGTRFLWSLGA